MGMSTCARLLAQPAVAIAAYVPIAVIVPALVTLSVVSGAVLVIVALAVATLVATKLPWVPGLDRPIHLSRHETVDDVLVRNDATTVLAGMLPVVSLLPFLFTPTWVIAAVGPARLAVLLVGGAVIEAWVIFRLTAQYLPRYSPHLFDEDYRPPIATDDRRE